MNDIMTERTRVNGLEKWAEAMTEKHNALCSDHLKLINKYNVLRKSVNKLCLICLGLDAILLLHVIDISNIKKKLNKEEEQNKEG